MENQKKKVAPAAKSGKGYYSYIPPSLAIYVKERCAGEFVRPEIADKSRGSEGLVSADRSEAAALLGTTPRSIPKSSASDFAPLSTAE